MKRQTIFSLIGAVLLVACAEKPEAHLPREQMQQIIFDLHLAETYSMTLHEDSTRRNSERNLDSLAIFYRSVFKHHQVTQQQFEKSLQWYLANPQELDTIYTRMIPEMSKLEAVMN